MEDSALKPGDGSDLGERQVPQGASPPIWDWPPPVQAAAFVAGATAFLLLATGHCEAGLGVLALGLVLQAWGLAQLKGTYKAMQRALKR
jgi:hypothetical protein